MLADDARLTPTGSRLATAFSPLPRMGRLPQVWPVAVSACLPSEQVAKVSVPAILAARRATQPRTAPATREEALDLAETGLAAP
jgi:hypothetical protein